MQTIKIIGKTVPRIGFGTIRLPGPGVMGPPRNYNEAIRVLKRAVELGIKVIDTAWYYGPNVSTSLITEALYPYPDDLIIVTKLGGNRGDDGSWGEAHTPEELRAGMENDLRTMKLDCVPIVHLRWEGKELDDSFKKAVETMLTMKQEGKLQHIGVSNVTEEQLTYVHSLTPVATVSNAYSLLDRHDDAMIDRCTKENIPYLPFFPLASGRSAAEKVLQKWANELHATPTQISIAALLKRSPTILPIPGTSSLNHLEENWAAGELDLPKEAFDEIISIPEKPNRW